MKIIYSSLLFCAFVCGLSLSAASTAEDVVKLGQILDSTLSPSWGDQFESGIECRPLSDIPGTYLCATTTREQLQKMMGRVSYFVESTRPGVIVSESDADFQASPQANYQGHDIMAKDMEKFFEDLTAACKADAKLCANSLEAGLYQSVIQDAHQKGLSNYVVIAASIETDFSWNADHEFFHARFFLNPSYQARVREYWNTKLTDNDRQMITKTLARHYNVSGSYGELLLLNEFQAYTLEFLGWQGWYFPEDLPVGNLATYQVAELRQYLGDLLPPKPFAVRIGRNADAYAMALRGLFPAAAMPLKASWQELEQMQKLDKATDDQSEALAGPLRQFYKDDYELWALSQRDSDGNGRPDYSIDSKTGAFLEGDTDIDGDGRANSVDPEPYEADN